VRTTFTRVVALVVVGAAVSAAPALSAPQPAPTWKQQDVHFLTTAVEASCFQVAAASYVLQHSPAAPVRALAQRLVGDDARALDQLQSVAKSMKVGMPVLKLTAIHRTMLDQLGASRASGVDASAMPKLAGGSLAASCAAFRPGAMRGAKSIAGFGGLSLDRTYAGLQVAMLKRSVSTYMTDITRGQEEPRAGIDPALHRWTNKTLPILRAQLQLAHTAAAAA
jgi:predicted outer membrane protein